MEYKPYWKKLKNTRWQKKRLELLNAADFKCQSPFCFNDENAELHIHHRIYIKGKQPWEYEPWAYIVVCDKCHECYQNSMQAAAIILAKSENLTFGLGGLSSTNGCIVREFFDALANLCECSDDILKILTGMLVGLDKKAEAEAFRLHQINEQTDVAIKI